jgi:hypothetical protein
MSSGPFALQLNRQTGGTNARFKVGPSDEIIATYLRRLDAKAGRCAGIPRFLRARNAGPVSPVSKARREPRRARKTTRSAAGGASTSSAAKEQRKRLG